VSTDLQSSSPTSDKRSRIYFRYVLYSSIHVYLQINLDLVDIDVLTEIMFELKTFILILC
jgi:hypothetical protein